MFVLFAPLVALALEPAHVAEVAATAELPVDEVAAHLSGLVRDDSVLERMATPWERKPWHLYRGLFLTEARIEKGRAFRQLHAELFARAEAQTHVPASVILAILGVETTYGEGMGNDSVATALYTLGFHHRRRGRFFRSELGHFLRLATDEGWPIGEPLGSYAGAMGMGQFMPSSYRSYGVDFDKDGDVDLFHSPADAIGSVANYLAAHGWAEGPILLEATVTRDPTPLLSGGLALDRTIAELRAAGVVVEGAGDDARARLFKFDGPSGPEYRVGLQNFYVITRYNRSPLYARAVTELAASY